MLEVPPGDPFWVKLGRYLVTLVQRRFRRGGDEDLKWAQPKLRPEGRPLLLTSHLMSSIDHIEVPGPAGTSVRVGTADKRAAIHQFGGVIVPKTAKALFIPLTAKGRKVGPKPLGMRSFAKIYEDGRVTYKPELKYGVDFVLKQSVTIPARPFLRFSPADVMLIKAFVARELANSGGNA